MRLESSPPVEQVPVNVAKHIKTWSDLDLPSALESALVDDLRLATPTEIQRKALPRLLHLGENLLVSAETGCGKTLCYVLPILHRILRDRDQLPRAGTPYALVLVPTADLARQVAAVVALLARAIPDLKVVPTTGLHDTPRADATVLITTPAAAAADTPTVSGVRRRFEGARFVVVDEADLLLSAGAGRDTTRILQALGGKADGRQVVLAGATVCARTSKWPLAAAAKLVPNLRAVASSALHRTLAGVTEEFVSIDDEEQRSTVLAGLLRHLHSSPPDAPVPSTTDLVKSTDPAAPHPPPPKDITIVFTQRAADVPDLASHLQTAFPKWPIHAFTPALGPDTRAATLHALTTSPNPSAIVVTTDVLARGIDLPRVTHVVQHTLARDAATYLHRVGRTARGAQTTGRAVALFGAGEAPLATALRLAAQGETVAHPYQVVREMHPDWVFAEERVKAWNEAAAAAAGVADLEELDDDAFRAATRALKRIKEVETWTPEVVEKGEEDGQKTKGDLSAVFSRTRSWRVKYRRTLAEVMEDTGLVMKEGKSEGKLSERTCGEHTERRSDERFERDRGERFERDSGERFERNRGERFERNRGERFQHSRFERFERGHSERPPSRFERGVARNAR
ncbi:ATP-dependent RNA helicase [Allomyces arbusculus]|nr:ATP-dependent RNA helicase [Allomyces arbusculus]